MRPSLVRRFLLSLVGLWSVPQAWAATAVYYSVGTSTADLKSGSPTVTISSGTATFSVAQATNVGVGDVVTYNTSSKAYIAGRTSATVYAAVTVTGTTPENVTDATVNSIKRVFNKLSDAENQSDDAGYLATSALTTGNYQLNWVCYKDGVLSDSVWIDGWTTGADNYIRIFTPVAASEVGTSQRHTGSEGTGFVLRNNGSYGFVLYGNYQRIDGLEIDANGMDGIYTASGGTEHIEISNCIIHNCGSASGCVIHNGGSQTYEIWNNIIYHAGGAGTSGFEGRTGSFYNNSFLYTGSSPNSRTAIYGNANVTAINNMAFGYGGSSGFKDFTGTFHASSDYNISSDGSAPGTDLDSGTTDASGNSGTTVVDTGQNFQTTVSAGYWFNNDTDQASSKIAAVVSDTQLTLEESGVTGNTKAFSINRSAYYRSASDNYSSASEGSENLHLASAADAVEAGTDLSSTFVRDIDYEVRSATWDIGADESSSPTAVTLRSLRALGEESLVRVLWETGEEIENLGFNLYRAASPGGTFARINETIIPGIPGSPAGRSYAFEDVDVVRGRAYYYLLEDVDAWGKRTRHGPLPVVWNDGAPADGAAAPHAEEAAHLEAAGTEAREELPAVFETEAEGPEEFVPAGSSSPHAIAYWPIEGCCAQNDLAALWSANTGGESQPIEADRSAAVWGAVSCSADRFGIPESALEFAGYGCVAAYNLPALDGDFSLSAWVYPSAPGPGDRDDQVFLECIDTAQAHPLPVWRFIWRPLAGEIAFRPGEDAEPMRLSDVAAGEWHHVCVTRNAGRLAAYLDGVLADEASGSAGAVGDGFVMGEDLAGDAPFRGGLDAVLWEAAPREPSSLPALIVHGGPSVYLHHHAFGDVREIAVTPEGPPAFEAMRIRIQTGPLPGEDGRAFFLTGLRICVECGDPAATAPSAGLLEDGQLLVIDAAERQVPVGYLEAVSQDLETGRAAFEAVLDPSVPLPPDRATVLGVTFRRPPVVCTHRLRLGMESPDDVTIVLASGERAFIAGLRPVHGMAVEGDLLVITPEPAPRIRLSALPCAVSAAGAATTTRKLLHLRVDGVQAAPAVEDVVIQRIVFHSVAAPGATLDGIRNVRLVDGLGRLLGTGAIAFARKEIRFDCSFTTDIGEGLDVVLLADFDAAWEGPVQDRSEIVAQAGPRERCGRVLAAAGGAIVFLSFLHAWRRRPEATRTLRPIAGAILLSAGLLGISLAVVLGGCGRERGSSGGQFVQLSLASDRDFVAAGAQSGIPASIEAFPEGGIAGERHTLPPPPGF